VMAIVTHLLKMLRGSLPVSMKKHRCKQLVTQHDEGDAFNTSETTITNAKIPDSLKLECVNQQIHCQLTNIANSDSRLLA